MIITKSIPFTKDEIEKLRQRYGFFIKTVIDLEKRICSAGAQMHYESEQILLETGSQQKDVWGGGVELEMKTVLYNSFINIRPTQNNPSNEIQDPHLRLEFEKLTKYFFKELYGE